MPSKRHFYQRDKQSSVAAIVIGQQLALAAESLHYAKESLQHFRLGRIWSFVTGLPIYLSEAGSSQPISAASKIYKNERMIERLQFGCQRSSDITHRRKARGNQRQRRHHRLLLVTIAPFHFHRHRVLANGNGHSQRRTKLHAYRLHRLE